MSRGMQGLPFWRTLQKSAHPQCGRAQIIAVQPACYSAKPSGLRECQLQAEAMMLSISARAVQPSTSAARWAEAISRAGSPGRRAPMLTAMSRPVTRRAASTIIHPFTGTLELIACLEHLGDETLEEDPDPADRADQ